ncbi:MAG TPA: DMT family transporter, partial [Bacillota bacterium]|nr:DMT family transporter [Bacillota bacterium]
MAGAAARAAQSTFSRVAPYLAGLGFASIFGLSFLFTKSALDRIDFLRLLGFRFGLAAIVVSLIAASGLIPVSFRGKSVSRVLSVALFQPIAYFLFETNGIMRSSTSQAGMMIALIPIAVVVLSRVFLGEKASVGQLAFIFLSVGGVMVVALSGSGAGSNGYAGLLFLFGAVCSAAFYNVLSRRSSAQFSPFEITFVMMWTGAIAFNIISVLTHWQQRNLEG